MTTLQRPLVIALAYDGLCTFEFGVAVEIFGLPRPELGDNWYRFAVAAVEPGALQATGGIHVVADGGLELLPSAVLAWYQYALACLSLLLRAFFISEKQPPTGATLNNSSTVTLQSA